MRLMWGSPRLEWRTWIMMHQRQGAGGKDMGLTGTVLYAYMFLVL